MKDSSIYMSKVLTINCVTRSVTQISYQFCSETIKRFDCLRKFKQFIKKIEKIQCRLIRNEVCVGFEGALYVLRIYS